MRYSFRLWCVLLCGLAILSAGCSENIDPTYVPADGDSGADGDGMDREEDIADDDSADADVVDPEDVDDDTEGDTGEETEVIEHDTPAGIIRIATYNTHLFFDTVCDSGECGSDDFEQQLSQSAYIAKVQSLAASITLLDADIVLLQEIETADCLADLTDALAPLYPISHLGEIGYPGSIDTGVLADGDLITTINHRYQRIPLPDGSDTTTFAREFLEVHLDFDGAEVIVFVGHFKAKANDDPQRRLAEAMAARDIVTRVAAENPDALIVMGGDLNDVPGSDPINALEAGGDLLRVASELPDDRDATYWYYGEGQAIDHLFFDTGAAGSYVSGSVQVVTDFAGAHSLGSSDHAALRADFVLP